ncbi:MAG: division/cell wall cluster transcriptional repressor MraZ [Bacteroidales bacterium]|jgi:MraZ protein|nr:division/cell wall cluster transcriptional repressor MraZ [Bacteroidales bacterium]
MSNLDYYFWEMTIEKYGRLKLPTGLLKLLHENERQRFFATHGFGNHIMLWTETAFRKKLDFLNSLNRNVIENKRYRNALLRNMAFVECDSQNRLVIPKPLMEYYKIEKDAVLVFDNGQIEIWNALEFNTEFNIPPNELNILNEKICNTHETNSFENF